MVRVTVAVDVEVGVPVKVEVPVEVGVRVKVKELVAEGVEVGVPVRVLVQVALGVAVEDGVEVEVRVQVYPVVGFWQGGTLVKVAVAAGGGTGLVGVESPLFLQAVGTIKTAMTSKTQDNFRMFPPITSLGTG